jgi:hypothetical protein
MAVNKRDGLRQKLRCCFFAFAVAQPYRLVMIWRANWPGFSGDDALSVGRSPLTNNCPHGSRSN